MSPLTPELGALVKAATDAIDALEKVRAGSITPHNHSHRPWLLKRIDGLRSALAPFEGDSAQATEEV